jgi:hypothetical protein
MDSRSSSWILRVLKTASGEHDNSETGPLGLNVSRPDMRKTASSLVSGSESVV